MERDGYDPTEVGLIYSFPSSAWEREAAKLRFATRPLDVLDGRNSMDPVFTIPYSEYHAASTLLGKKLLPTSEGYSIYVPMSRQEKGVDLLVVRRQTGNKPRATLAIQVKSSRPYFRYKHEGKPYRHMFMFKPFTPSPLADFIFLIGVHPTDDDGPKAHGHWKPVIFALTPEQAEKLFKASSSKFFCVAFNDSKEPFLARGSPTDKAENFADYLLDNRINDIKSAFQ